MNPSRICAALALLFFLSLIALLLGGIGLINLIVVHWQRVEKNIGP